jgi:hypothetical protein
MEMADDRPTPVPVVPLHGAALDGDGRVLRIRRRPGRPRRAVVPPDHDELDYLDTINRLRDEHVTADPLVRVLRDQRPVGDVLREIKIGLAREAASIAWEIRHARQRGTTADQLASRRIDAVHKLGLVLLGERRLGITPDLDSDDPRMVKLAEMFVESVATVAIETLPAQMADALIRRLRGALGEPNACDQPT